MKKMLKLAEYTNQATKFNFSLRETDLHMNIHNIRSYLYGVVIFFAMILSI